MNYFTKSKDPAWDRIVNLFVKCDTNDMTLLQESSTCKLVFFMDACSILMQENKNVEKQLSLQGPCVLLLSEDDMPLITSTPAPHASIVFFKPTVINDSLIYEKLHSQELENALGSTLYQDYLLIRDFYIRPRQQINVIQFTAFAMSAALNLVEKMESELLLQADGYWPCRSRSFFIELLFSLKFNQQTDSYDEKENLVSQVTEYFNEHISERFTLDRLTKEFHINRNYLNAAFVESTGFTCLAHLLKMRIDLSKILLQETSLPIAEIAERIGFLDNNYFTKVFRKECSITPRDYRKKYGSCM